MPPLWFPYGSLLEKSCRGAVARVPFVRYSTTFVESSFAVYCTYSFRTCGYDGWKASPSKPCSLSPSLTMPRMSRSGVARRLPFWSTWIVPPCSRT